MRELVLLKQSPHCFAQSVFTKMLNCSSTVVTGISFRQEKQLWWYYFFWYSYHHIIGIVEKSEQRTQFIVWYDSFLLMFSNVAVHWTFLHCTMLHCILTALYYAWEVCFRPHTKLSANLVTKSVACKVDVMLCITSCCKTSCHVD